MLRIGLKEVSRLFVWGFEGTAVSPRLRRFLKSYPPAGVILFRRNIESPPQLRRLTEQLRRETSRPLLIGVDQEGGRVSRLPEPFAQFPPAAVLCDLAGKIGDFKRDLAGRERFSLELIRRVARFMGHELRAVGINLDFAPVLDVHSNRRNLIIGDRAFSSDPRMVARAGVAFFKGLADEGVIPCGKHFPGHGDTSSDSHLVLPRVKKSRRQLEAVEFFPFRVAIENRLPLLMTAHVLYPALDPENPATLSSKILIDLLRREMVFRGLVITDDLQMKGVSSRHSLLELAELSLAAGCDLLLVCRGGENGARLVERFARVVARSRHLQKRVAESNARLDRLVRRFPA